MLFLATDAVATWTQIGGFAAAMIAGGWALYLHLNRKIDTLEDTVSKLQENRELTKDRIDGMDQYHRHSINLLTERVAEQRALLQSSNDKLDLLLARYLPANSDEHISPQ